MTTNHTWVKHQVTPIEVLEGLDGHPEPFVDPDLDEACATDNAVYGCMACGEALTRETFASSCSTPQSGEQP